MNPKNMILCLLIMCMISPIKAFWKDFFVIAGVGVVSVGLAGSSYTWHTYKQKQRLEGNKGYGRMGDTLCLFLPLSVCLISAAFVVPFDWSLDSKFLVSLMMVQGTLIGLTIASLHHTNMPKQAVMCEAYNE